MNADVAVMDEDIAVKMSKRLVLKSEESLNLKEPLSYGWSKIRPNWLGFLNSPIWFLVAIFTYTLFQAISIIGLSNLTLPSIEKRFSLSAKEMGGIAAANDVSALVVVVFISYYGDYGNKIRWIGGGGILVGFGTLLFALPQLLIGTYEPRQIGPVGGLCNIERTSLFVNGPIACSLESDSRWYYMVIFVFAQVIIGAGISPFYALVPAYLDENVDPNSMPFYMGAWQIALFVGPGIGMAVGGKFLSIYVDITQPPGVNLTGRDPRWIGAWWLGFVIFGSLIIISSLFVLGFPREMPGAKKLRQEHIDKGNVRKANSLKKPTLKMLLPELKSMLTNWTFLCNTLGLTLTMLFVGGILPFLPKLLMLQFGLSPEDSGYAIAAMLSPTMIIGIAVGSIIVNRFSLKNACKHSALLIVLLRAFGLTLALAFLIPGCRNVNLAGLDTSYTNTLSGNSSHHLISTVSKSSLGATCNTKCGCSLSRFAPVCGSDNLTYFDVCHAGCSAKLPNKTFGNCSCIPPESPASQFGSAKFGYCDRDCKNFIFFAVFVAIDTLIQFSRIVPDKAVILRCVPDNKRAFALGIQYVFTKTLGFLPGPILFGHIVDMSCKLWQNTCGKKGRCFVYDNDKLDISIIIFGVLITVSSTFLYFLSWYFYKPDEEDKEQIVVDSGEKSNLENDTRV